MNPDLPFANVLDDAEFYGESKPRLSKRTRKNNRTAGTPEPLSGDTRTLSKDGSSSKSGLFSFASLFNHDYDPASADEPFEELWKVLMPDCLLARERLLWSNADVDPQKRRIRLMTPSEVLTYRREVLSRGELPPSQRLVATRLQMILRDPYEVMNRPYPIPAVVEKMDVQEVKPPPKEVLDALYAINATPFKNSFASRLINSTPLPDDPPLFMRDWHTRTDWMDLCEEIHLHYFFIHPDTSNDLDEIPSSIDFGPLLARDLTQVHDLLERTFWPDIDVSGFIDHQPERFTVVARFKRLVIGVALLSPPNETYITYLAVRTGWEGAHIASSMLYLLIKANPRRDITLHVSANNPAMVSRTEMLIGEFEIEEYVIGFYEHYLPPSSKASKNAFRLRLRQ